MSQENIEVIEEVWRAINRRDVEALVDLVTDDMEFRPPSYQLDGDVFHGSAGLHAWMKRTEESWRTMEGSLRVLASVGEHVVAAIDVRFVGHDSGVPFNQRIFTVYTLRERRLATSITYPSEQDALEAVGLAESKVSQENVDF